MSFIPEEYKDDSEYFGFTPVDADELGHLTSGEDAAPSVPVSSEVTEEISKLDGKLNHLIDCMENMGHDPDDDMSNTVDLSRIEEKLDTIIAMENQELAAAVNEQGESIRAIIDEVEERKEMLTHQYKTKIVEVEKMILPLLYNLTKNPEKEYIYWPNRPDVVQGQIEKILKITRG